MHNLIKLFISYTVVICAVFTGLYLFSKILEPAIDALFRYIKAKRAT